MADLITGVAAARADAGPVAAAFGLEPIDGGYRVKETADSYIDVIQMIFNWRIARTPKANDRIYDRAWCYAGTGPTSFTAAVLAAMAWDGASDTEPAGWNKNIQTGEWRTPEDVSAGA